MNLIPSTYTLLHRTDTNEYLTHFEFWDRNSIQWSANVDEAFLFRTHSDAEINGRMVLGWLGDPLNRHLANGHYRWHPARRGEYCHRMAHNNMTESQ
jgi:hypothetical protein